MVHMPILWFSIKFLGNTILFQLSIHFPWSITLNNYGNSCKFKTIHLLISWEVYYLLGNYQIHYCNALIFLNVVWSFWFREHNPGICSLCSLLQWLQLSLSIMKKSYELIITIWIIQAWQRFSWGGKLLQIIESLKNFSAFFRFFSTVQ